MSHGGRDFDDEEVPVPSGTGTSVKSPTLAAKVELAHLRVQLLGTGSFRSGAFLSLKPPLILLQH